MTKDKIDTIDIVDGLYVLNKIDSSIMSCITRQNNIWHLTSEWDIQRKG